MAVSTTEVSGLVTERWTIDLHGMALVAQAALHRPIDVQPYPIRLVNWFMSK